MTTKLRIKVGAIEFEYEGESSFTQEAIKDLFSHMEAMFNASGAKALDHAGPQAAAGPAPQANGSGPSLQLHTNSIAAKLGADTGPELAIAAAAHIQLVQGRDRFSRNELLKEMQSATSRYKKSMSSNLTKYIQGLIKDGRINQLGTDAYALKASELSSLESTLAA
jgi:hypothetical protein